MIFFISDPGSGPDVVPQNMNCLNVWVKYEGLWIILEYIG